MTSHALFYREILRVEIPTRRRVNRFPLVGPKSNYWWSSRKNNRNEERLINVFLLSIILLRGGLALVSEHQLHRHGCNASNHSELISWTLWRENVLIQRNWSYSFVKWWESLVTIFEQWRAWSITWPNNFNFFFQVFLSFVYFTI